MTIENGQVSVPEEYFLKMAKLDYENYTLALAREFYQNSVDAGATEIYVGFDVAGREVIVRDNGCGMDYDTIKNKLLVLGGSQKSKGSTGAFGKAKEVLFFSWKSYKIRTGYLEVKGRGAKYTIEKGKPFRDGTECRIVIWEDENYEKIFEAFKYVAKRFEVDAKININGRVIDCELKRGQLVKSCDWANIYLDKNAGTSYYLKVRVNGQWMFQSWLGSDPIGEIIVEVKGHSLDALTSNRDGLKGEYKKQFDQLVSEVVQNRKSALEPPKVVIRDKYRGTGKVTVDMSAIKDRLEAIVHQDAETTADAVIDALSREAANMTTLKMDRITETAKRPGHFNLKDRYAFIGYEPDFVVVYEKSSNRSNRCGAFLTSKKAKILAHAWTETLRQVLLDCERYLEFTVGFNFSQDTTAAYECIEGEHYFYINPFELLHELTPGGQGAEGRPKWWTNRNLLREDLHQKAIHEITHLDHNYHNEDFILKSEYIRAQTWKSLVIYQKIIRESFVTV